LPFDFKNQKSMKNIIRNLFLSTIILIGLNSCVSTRTGYQSSPVISRYVELDHIMADVKFDEENKLKGESEATYVLMFKVKGDRSYADGILYSTDSTKNVISILNPNNNILQNRLLKIRAAATYKALENKDYDLLVHPTYKVTIQNYVVYKKYTVTVEGYGAKYHNFRTERLYYYSKPTEE